MKKKKPTVMIKGIPKHFNYFNFKNLTIVSTLCAIFFILMLSSPTIRTKNIVGWLIFVFSSGSGLFYGLWMQRRNLIREKMV